jgi:FAS-associated factor 2
LFFGSIFSNKFTKHLFLALLSLFSLCSFWISTSPASTSSPQYNFPQVSNQNQVAPQQGLLPLLSAARSFKPSLLLDRNYSRDFYNRIGSALTGRAPSPSHPGEVTGVPVDFYAGNEQPHLSGQRPTNPDVARTELDASRYGNDVEEEMIQAAIAASKRDAEMGSPNVRNRNLNVCYCQSDFFDLYVMLS